jgi:hypothetical protein
MDLTQSSSATSAKLGRAAVPQVESVVDAGSDVRSNLRNAVRNGAEAPRKSSGYGLPCAKCRLYYPANFDSCPACNSKERVSASAVPVIPKPPTAGETVPDNVVVEKEREAFLKEFKSQLFAAHAEVASAPAICVLGEHHIQGSEAASICKHCYDRVRERVDVLEAGLHIDLKEAAQIIYEAVWADPSDPTKTYTNAASALIGELRKRSGVANVIGPFQPLDN